MTEQCSAHDEKDFRNLLIVGNIFSVAFPGKIKAWHLHKETFLNYWMTGQLNSFYLMIEDQFTKNQKQEIILSTKIISS